MEKLPTTKADKKIAAISSLTDEQVAIIKNTVAKGTTNTELAYFLQVANSYHLSPFKREVWCYKDSKDNVIVFAGRDGHLAAAQKDPRWNGIASSEIREKDSFRVNIPDGKIEHLFGLGERGKIIGAYAICKPKGCEIATIEIADFDTYNKGYSTWKSDPVAMIKKVAETHCLKKAYGLSGLQSEFDYEINEDGRAFTLDHENKPTMQQIESIRSMIEMSTFDEDHRQFLEEKLKDCTHAELDSIREALKDNQLDPIKETGNYSQTDLKKTEIPDNF